MSIFNPDLIQDESDIRRVKTMEELRDLIWATTDIGHWSTKGGKRAPVYASMMYSPMILDTTKTFFLSLDE
jgi:hypothetical protein